MKVTVTQNYDEMSKAAYKIVQEVLKCQNPILGLATGSTPLGLYALISEACKKGDLSLKHVKSVNLDEYIGLPKGHKESYRYFMDTNLFDKTDIDKSSTYVPNGNAEDMQAECDRYNSLLNRMRQSVQILGIGGNGHIGFNEPGTPFSSVTHLVDLQERTRQDNARFFNSIDEVPRQAITMGISNIMNAERIVILASGKSKAEAVRAAAIGEVSEQCPASVLQKHPDAVLIVDEAAAELL